MALEHNQSGESQDLMGLVRKWIPALLLAAPCGYLLGDCAGNTLPQPQTSTCPPILNPSEPAEPTVDEGIPKPYLLQDGNECKQGYTKGVLHGVKETTRANVDLVICIPDQELPQKPLVPLS